MKSYVQIPVLPNKINSLSKRDIEIGVGSVGGRSLSVTEAKET
jgi:hypothetical protein